MYCKLKELSKISGIPYITLYKEIRDNKLKAVKIRNALYVYDIDWKEYVIKNNFMAQGYNPEKLLEASKNMNNEQLLATLTALRTHSNNILTNANDILKGKQPQKTTSFDTDEFLKQLGISPKEK